MVQVSNVARYLRSRYLYSLVVPIVSVETAPELPSQLPVMEIVKTAIDMHSNTQVNGLKELGGVPQLIHRTLEGGGGEGSGNSHSGGADFSMFAIVSFTLGLILITEGVLHLMDHCASKRTFFRKTLNTCYRELAIVGIVEWMVHLYSLKGPMEYNLLIAFTDVHYLLFYTAIVNAIQSFILHIGCRRLTLNWWVKTEELELNHYIELRGEFDRLKQRLDMQRYPSSEGPTTIQSLCLYIRRMLANPVLVPKYHQLLVQVRFHELRINIIRANKLPFKFRVSDYLKKCEQEVLMKFISIGKYTWITLMAATSLVYFTLSIALHSSDREELSPNVMKFLFYGVCLFLIVVSFVILQKVKWIFFQIMSTNLIDCGLKNSGIQTCLDVDGESKSVIACQSSTFSRKAEVLDSSRADISNQLDLFWGKNPAIITGVIQVIQFGYSMLLSFVLVYWNMINTEHWGHPLMMILVCLGCFAVFFWIMIRIIPRFIICTNIGQLMNTVMIRELLAKHRLEELIRRRRRRSSIIASGQVKLSQCSISNDKNDIQDIELPVAKRGLISEESKRYLRLASLVAAPTNNLRLKMQSYVYDEESSNDESSSSSEDLGGNGEGQMKVVKNCMTQQDDKTLIGSSIWPSSEEKYPPERNDSKLKCNASKISLPSENACYSSHSLVQLFNKKSCSAAQKDSIKQEPVERSQTFAQDCQKCSRHINQSSKKISFEDDCKVATQVSVAPITLLGTQSSRNSEETCEHGGLKKFHSTQDSLAQKITKSRKFSKCLRSFLLSKLFSIFNVFVTWSCFFLVGLRMNTLMIDSHEIDGTIVFPRRAENLFWAEVFFLILIVVEGLSRLGMFIPSKASAAELPLCISGAFGFFLGILCMSLLLVSEALRPSKYGSFGTRSAAGIGSVEPFTSLIFLRFFSVYFGNLINRVFWSISTCIHKDLRRGDTCISNPIELNSKFVNQGQNVSTSLRNISHHDAVLEIGKKTGTIVELWQIAVGLFPDIVDQYGEFSGEMLQAMLGVQIEAKNNFITQSPEMKLRFQGKANLNCSQFGINTLKTSDGEYPDEDNQSYMGQALHESNDDGNYIEKLLVKSKAEDLENVLDKDDVLPSQGIPSALAPHFDNFSEINTEQQQLEDADVTFMLIEPDAPITHPMCRCERRLLPLLNCWMLVDVVMTEFELVCLDVLDHDLSRQTVAFSRIQDEGRNALVTKGGESTSLLRHIVFGRIIVGHVDLRCVERVKVLRILQPSAVKGMGENFELNKQVEANNNAAAHSDVIRQIDEKRWERVQEDQLQIFTAQGTIHQLRFLCDLEEKEAKLMLMTLCTTQMQTSEALAWGHDLAQLQASNILQPFAEADIRGEIAMCELEIISRDGVSMTSPMKWRKMKNLRRSLVLSRSHQPRASSFLSFATGPRKLSMPRADITSDSRIELHEKVQPPHRKTFTHAGMSKTVAQLNNQHVDQFL